MRFLRGDEAQGAVREKGRETEREKCDRVQT